MCLRYRKLGFDPWVRKITWRREWVPTPVFLSGEFHAQRSLVGYRSWGHKESHMTEWLIHIHNPFLIHLQGNKMYRYLQLDGLIEENNQ